MNLTAVFLVLTSGFIHAGWNYLAKSSKDKLSFLWGSKVVSLVSLSLLLFYYLVFYGGGGELEGNYLSFILFGLGSGFIHSFYIYFLGMAYRYGDISFTYPIARGLAPFLVALFSFFFIGETPSLVGALGMLLVAVGMVLLVGDKSYGEKDKNEEKGEDESVFYSNTPLIFAVFTAVTIASYTFLDGRGSREFTPLLFVYAYSLVSTILLTVPVLGRGKKFAIEIKTNLKTMFFTGIMMPLSYFLALSAMQLTQLSYVASLRNISVVFVTLLGVIKLKEEFTFFGLTGSLVIFLGAVLLSIG